MMASFLGAGMQDTLVRLGMHSIFREQHGVLSAQTQC